MATIRGILGVIEGSAGSSTFSTLNGRNILRQKVGSNGSNSVPQQRTRNQFKALAALHKAGLGTATRAGLLKQNGKSSYNRFVGLNFGTATSADVNTAVATVDFAKLVVSAGAVLGVARLTATAGAGTVAFAFGNNTDGVSGLGLDKVTVVVMNNCCYTVAIEASVFVSCCSFLVACSGLIINEQQETSNQQPATTCNSRRMSVTA